MADTEAVERHFNRASLLATSNRSEDKDEAKSIFLELLKIEPTHLEVWNNLGGLLFETGYTTAAKTAYTAAVTYHPHAAVAHVNLGNVLLDKGELSEAEKHFNTALELNSDLHDARVNAHKGLASVLHRLGREQESRYHRDMGFGKRPLSTLSYCGERIPIQLLILASALEGNIPWKRLIDCSMFQTTILAVEYTDVQLPLPFHHLVFNAIGDADLCQQGLEIASQLLKKTLATVINRPEAVMRTGRLANASQLGCISGVIAPRMTQFARSDFCVAAGLNQLSTNNISFPLLLRPPGFHGGNYFVLVGHPDTLASAIAQLPGENLLAIEFLDSCCDDKLFRKFRVMSINGKLYPIHLGISTRWKVHYFSSDMDQNEQYRAEEEAFLYDYTSFLGHDTIYALEKISETLSLDYCGIDFGVDRHGNVLLYEANSTMLINPPAKDNRWNYKRFAIESALSATRKMFVEQGSKQQAS